MGIANTRFDNNYYDFIFAAKNEKYCVVFYEHKGRGTHFHSTVFNLEEDESITVNLLNPIDSIEELLVATTENIDERSECKLW